MKLKSGMKILFDGDSITDAGRDREDRYSLSGYNRYISGSLAALGIECFNRGVSGNRSCDLLLRSHRSCCIMCLECGCRQNPARGKREGEGQRRQRGGLF